MEAQRREYQQAYLSMLERDRKASPVYQCATCRDAEWVPDGSISMKPCPDCYAQRRAERLQRISGLTEVERQITLDDVEVGPNRPGTVAMVDAARRFVAEPFGFLTVHGKPGNAKSVTLAGVVNESLALGRVAVYVTLSDLLGWVSSAWGRDADGKPLVINESAWGRLQELASVPVLCIDEFDPLKVKQDARARQIESDILDKRYRLGVARKAGTVIAMNGDPKMLETWMYSRLAQYPIIYNGDPDMRPLIGRVRARQNGGK